METKMFELINVCEKRITEIEFGDVYIDKKLLDQALITLTHLKKTKISRGQFQLGCKYIHQLLNNNCESLHNLEIKNEIFPM